MKIINHFYRLRLISGCALLSESFIYIIILLSKKVNKALGLVAFLTKSRLIILFIFLVAKCIIMVEADYKL